MRMDPVAVTTAAIGLLVAGVIKGATGLGYTSCALPFLVFAIGLKPAMALVIAPALATNFSLLFAAGHVGETVARFKWLYLTMLPGIAFGVWLLSWVQAEFAVHLLGLVIIGYVVLALAKPSLSIPTRLQGPLQFPAGFLNGVVTGLTGAQVMPLFPYVMALQLDADRTVQAINVAVLVASTILAVGLVSTGLMTPWLLVASVAAVVPALAGVEIGNRARQRIPVQRFRMLVLLTLALVGTLLLAR
jgi:uncharacterized membrane protein YfcA